ncbi:hypothetical protein X801_09819 [Opisthorchis viverrini]|uniref:Uncharacterized protein n=1 Tax=Opisthorchis viverrini TaxID=6198 RepID=A0A1S8WIW5_OPIVI|nr:hypothetical protein X801_09819 [Opisthorchis viverrini]
MPIYRSFACFTPVSHHATFQRTVSVSPVHTLPTWHHSSPCNSTMRQNDPGIRYSSKTAQSPDGIMVPVRVPRRSPDISAIWRAPDSQYVACGQFASCLVRMGLH